MKRGMYHITKHKKNEKHKKKLIRFFDKFILIIAFIAPLVELPQLLEIYLKKSAENVSIITWGLFVVFGIPWLIYGILHKEKPIIILYSLWILIESLIVIGILIYG